MAAYIRRHRDRLSGVGVALSAADQAWLTDYVGVELLMSVRVVERDPLPIWVPPGGGVARRMGFDFPEVGMVAAITFDHVIVSREPMTRSTLLHELVHVVQFRMLGLRAFSRLYVRGLLSTGSYDAIPLERCAQEMEAWCDAGRRFSVESEVAGWKF